MPYQCISVDEAKELIDSSEVILADIRDKMSYRASSIPNSVHVTKQNFDEFLEHASKDTPLIVYCYHGNMSKGAAAFLCSQGFTQVYSMDGGFDEWALKF